MISISRDELLELSGGSLVAGNVLARVNGVNTILARTVDGAFSLTEDGISFAENASKPAKKAPRARAAKQGEEPETDVDLGVLDQE